MEPCAAPSGPDAAESPRLAGELVVPAGPLQGARGILRAPLTVLGRAPDCDVRLDHDEIDALHCVLAVGPDGVIVRDLHSAAGTLLNGDLITTATLRNGDVLSLGPVDVQVRLYAAPSSNGDHRHERSALHLQAAAVAAQQAALDEQEGRLRQRQAALEQQENQLAAHLEQKRQRLVALQERAQAERRALQSDRAAHEKSVARVTGDLGQAQRELLEQQERLLAERRRVSALVRRFKKRTRQQVQAERDRLALREEELANEECNLVHEREELEQRRAELDAERLEFNADYELGRRKLYDAWLRLRGAQRAWHARRRAERIALKLRAREIEDAEIAVVQVRETLVREQAQRQAQRLDLERDLEGLRRRCNNQRLRLVEQEPELSAAGEAGGTSWTPSPNAPPAPMVAVPIKDGLPERLTTLARVAGELADQRLELAEQWERLAQTQTRWEHDQARITDELESLVARLRRQEESQRAREHAQSGVARAVEQRHHELVALEQRLIGWRARLSAREHAWEGERARLLVDVKHREELAESHLDALVEIRQGWAERRREEVERLQQAREEYERLWQDVAAMRQQLEARGAGLEDQKRKLAEKALALEQLRQALLIRSGDSAGAERRLERLRRRWLTQHASMLRAVKRGRAALQTELEAVNARAADLERRADDVRRTESELTDKLTAWEHKQILTQTRHTRLEQALQNAQVQRVALEQELIKTRGEVEQIARALLDEPEAAVLRIGKAA